MTESEIIKGCRRGDRVCCKAFVDNYSNYLYAICYRYMGNTEVAKDALQDALVQVLRSLDKYEERGSFKGWISSITVKKCLDNLRKEKRHKYADMDNVAEPYREEESSLRLERDDVMRFVEAIPENYRIAINMFLIEGYSHKEIADCLCITEGGSRSLVSRGRKMIMEAFAYEQKMEQKRIDSVQAATDGNFSKLKII